MSKFIVRVFEVLEAGNEEMAGEFDVIEGMAGNGSSMAQIKDFQIDSYGPGTITLFDKENISAEGALYKVALDSARKLAVALHKAGKDAKTALSVAWSDYATKCELLKVPTLDKGRILKNIARKAGIVIKAGTLD